MAHERNDLPKMHIAWSHAHDRGVHTPGRVELSPHWAKLGQ